MSRLSEEGHEFIQLECQCGECAIEEFMAGKDCQKSVQRSVPRLTIITWDLDQQIFNKQEMRFSDYKNSLKEQDNAIRTEYASLLLNTMRELKMKYSLEVAKQRVRLLLTPKDALGSQYKRMYKQGLDKRLKDMQTFEEFRTFLEQFCSWFNIDFIADLRKVLLGYDSQDPVVITYKEHLVRYLQRCCFQLTVCDPESQTEHNEIVCKTSTDFHEIKEEQLDIFEHRLRQCISLPVSTRRIAESGQEMIFYVKKPLSPATTKEPKVLISVDLLIFIHDALLATIPSRKKSLFKFILAFIFLVLITCVQGLTVSPAYQTKSLGSVRINPGETLLTTFCLHRVSPANKGRLIFTKHPFNDNSSIIIRVRVCNRSQDEEITNCTISSSNHSCSIQRAVLSSEVSVGIFAYSTSSSLPVIENGIVHAYLPIRAYLIGGISIVLFFTACYIMSTTLDAMFKNKNKKNSLISFLIYMVAICIPCVICSVIIFNPLSLPL